MSSRHEVARTDTASMRGRPSLYTHFYCQPLVKEADLGCISRLARRPQSSHDKGQLLQLHSIFLPQNDSHNVGFPEHGQYG